MEMVSTPCFLLLFLMWRVSSGDDRPRLLEESLPDVIPDGVFEQPMAFEGKIDSSWKPQTKSLLQPREYAHRPRPARPMRYSGGSTCEGACITSRVCEYHHGTTKGTCSNGNVCCIFEKSCGGVSREKVSFFRSPRFPQSINESMECSYRIYPSENTCALKIDFERFELRKAKRYTKTEKCIDDVMFIMNTAGGPTEGVCEMENHTAVVEVQPSSSHPVIVLFVAQSSQVSWSLKINQINCKSMQPWKNLPACGRQLMFEPNEYDSDTQPTALESPFNEPKHSVQSPLPHPYIVNGKDAEKNEFPWQVSLQLHSKSSHRCGGSILNDRYILTAAHCLYRNAYTSKQKMKIIVGDYILDTEKDGEHEEFEIEKIIVHYNYKPTESHINDIAVIKLKETIKFNDKVQPICLPSEGTEVYNKSAIVSGWGRLNGTDPAATASRLQKLDVKIIMNSECKELVKKEYEDLLKRNLSFEEVAKASVMGISETQLCGLSKPSTSVCFVSYYFLETLGQP
ncbi:unnamed protein product [Orchesella dallaii]|uniref:Uncharacterized protein n=1 Tax=Orchesella dallaii TaxID=48710 RepID=A0ABP1PVA4_9HEXA